MNFAEIPRTIDDYRKLCNATRAENHRSATRILGEIGESICLAISSEAGFKIIFLAQVGGSGPALSLGKEKAVLPDFELRCTAHRYGAYLDAKCKAGPIYAYTRKQYRHGIDRRNYESYVNHGADFDQAAGLFLCECFEDAEERATWSGAILMQSFANLGQPYQPLGEEHPPKVYWRRNQFRELGKFTVDEWARMASGHWAPNLEHHFRAVFHPTKQQALFG